MTYLSPEEVDAAVAALDADMIMRRANGAELSFNPVLGKFKIVADREGMITTYYMSDYEGAINMFTAEAKREPENLVPLKSITTAMFYHSNQMYPIMQVGPFHVFGRHSDGNFVLKRQDELTTEYLGSFETAEEVHAALNKAMLDAGVRYGDHPVLNIVDAANKAGALMAQKSEAEIARVWTNAEGMGEAIVLLLDTKTNEFKLIQEVLTRSDNPNEDHQLKTYLMDVHPTIQAAVIAFNAEVARK